jgi:hypothetical protein
MRLRLSVTTICLLVVLTAWPSFAWLRGLSNWANLIDEAEVIAVAHVVGEMVYVKHDRPPVMGTSWEFHARLAIDEVLKGECPHTEIPLILHYGLSPSRYVQDAQVKQNPHYPKEYPGLAIWDSGSSAVGPMPLLEDARQPAVWVLAHYTDRFGRNGAPTEELSVREPEHIRPLKMLPLFRGILKPDAIEEQLAFLHDPDPQVRTNCLGYFRDRDEKRAFPAVAELLTNEDVGSWLVVEACVKLGGQDAIAYLRPLLATESRGLIWSVADALAQLHDVESVPRLLELLATGEKPFTRAAAASALRRMGDTRAIPGLLAALKDDGAPGESMPNVWRYAQEALEWLVRCRLSPNGDKAQRWWDVAQHLDPAAWEHFGVAQTVQSLLMVGPNAQEEVNGRLRTLSGRARGEVRGLDFSRRDEYDPVSAQQQWRRWLEAQGWDDYQALPSQMDDELVLKVEPTASLDSGEPVHLRYSVKNTSDKDLWLCKHYRELLAERFVNGNGSYGEDSQAARGELSADSFFLLRSGEQRFIVGNAIIYNHPHLRSQGRPAIIVAALRFDRKGTPFGYDAWVGEVWAEPIEFPVEATQEGAAG